MWERALIEKHSQGMLERGGGGVCAGQWAGGWGWGWGWGEGTACPGAHYSREEEVCPEGGRRVGRAGEYDGYVGAVISTFGVSVMQGLRARCVLET